MNRFVLFPHEEVYIGNSDLSSELTLEPSWGLCCDELYSADVSNKTEFYRQSQIWTGLPIYGYHIPLIAVSGTLVTAPTGQYTLCTVHCLNKRSNHFKTCEARSL